MDEGTKARRWLPLTEATFHVLISLVRPLHGYGVMQAVSRRKGGRVRIGPGTLYGALRKLLENGLVERADGTDAELERRKAYVLTPLGRRVVALEVERLAGLVRVGRKGLRTMAPPRRAGTAGRPSWGYEVPPTRRLGYLRPRSERPRSASTAGTVTRATRPVARPGRRTR
jgi:DNA-binding PadR family transcriptional regulator